MSVIYIITVLKSPLTLKVKAFRVSSLFELNADMFEYKGRYLILNLIGIPY